MRYVVILNPNAGYGRAARRQAALEAAFARAGLRCELRCTEAPGHARRLAREAAHVAEAVVAAGGDGTVHEVAGGLLEAGTGAALGILPLGTGNDAAEALGLPRRWPEALAVLKAATPRAVDYGRVRWEEDDTTQTRTFFNNVGAGFDALVGIEAQPYKRFGALGYVAAVFGTLRRWHGPTARITGYAGARSSAAGAAPPDAVLYEGPLLLVTAGNGIRSGGRFYLTPHASMMDGMLDVCIVHDTPPGRIVQVLPRALNGTHTRAPEVHMARVLALDVEASDGLPVHADGEILARHARRVRLDVVPGGLPVLLPGPS